MDYKEKYEQALEVAQRFYNNSVAITKKGLEDIFPELVESRDERIRKELIQYLEECTNLPNGKYCRADFFAWLEKQGEKDKLIKELGEYKIKYTQEVLNQQLEKQGKGKHTKFTEEQGDAELRKSIEVVSKILGILLQSEKFQKDAREHLFDKGDRDMSGIYDIYAEEAVKYVKALYKHLNK